MEQQDKFYKGLFWGAALGAAMGTVMGLLFAPYRGRETQQRISGKVKSMLDKATDLYESSEHDGMYNNDAKTRAQGVIDTARDEAKKILSEADSLLRDIKGHPAKTRES
jgi:gas vesicle protein